MKAFLILLAFSRLSVSNALEIDEKLTIRFLKVSNSKKTILINRGAEDGLVVGDHAKFFITSGVIARGIVEKVSPSRSIWSVYRIVDASEVTNGKVLNLKIASPVKITDDQTKSLKDEVIPNGSDREVKGDSTSTELGTPRNEDEQKELEGMGLDENVAPSKKNVPTKLIKPKADKEVSELEEIPKHGGENTFKNWEIWGMLYLNSLSGTVSDNSSAGSTTSTAATATAIDFSAGIEKYFLANDSFLKDSSFTLFVHKRSIETGDAIKISTDWFEFGLGGSYHFYNHPSSTEKLIGYSIINLGAGSATNKVTASGQDNPADGSSTFFSVGLGAKYVLSNGYGVRSVLDYYSASESYNYPGNVTIKRTLSGPRINFGLSYRF